MNLFDLAVIGSLLLAFAGGWQLGFLTRAVSWLGLAGGLFVAARLLPRIVDRLQGAPPSRTLLAIAAVLVALSSLGLVAGLAAGAKLRRAVSGEQLRTWDRVLGGLASSAGVLVIVWLLVPVMADVPQWPAQQARGSRVARMVEVIFPPAPDSIAALGRVVGEEGFPRVLDALQPAPRLVAPPETLPLSDAVLEQVIASIVRIEGVACRRIQAGSGFVAGEELVLTNAHVVAGEPSSTVQRDDGVVLEATVVLFDPARDLALLAVPGLERTPLPLRVGQVGERGGVFGFPGGGELRIAPFELARLVTATGRDIYDVQRVSREVYFVASHLGSGDSGAALVGSDGAVIGVAFAVAPDREGVAYALTTREVLAALAVEPVGVVDTGACLF